MKYYEKDRLNTWCGNKVKEWGLAMLPNALIEKGDFPDRLAQVYSPIGLKIKAQTLAENKGVPS